MTEDSWELTTLTAAEADAALHDALFELDSIALSRGVFTMSGEIERHHERRMYKHRTTLTVTDSSDWTLEDEARMGWIDVLDFEETDTGFRIISHYPVKLSIETKARTMELRQGAEPFQIRRWFRWEDL